MKKEYKLVYSDKLVGIEAKINELADNGWVLRHFNVHDGNKYAVMVRRKGLGVME